MISIKKIIIPAFSTLCLFLIGCGVYDNGEGTPGGWSVKKEADFNADPAATLKRGQIAVLEFEASGTHAGDSAGSGVDEVPFEVSPGFPHRFCIEDSANNNHLYEVFDESGMLVASTDVASGCVEANLNPGIYKLRFTNQNPGSGEDERVLLFISSDHREVEDVPEPEAYDRPEEEAERQPLLLESQDASAAREPLALSINSMQTMVEYCVSAGGKFFNGVSDSENPPEGHVYFYSDVNYMGCRLSFGVDTAHKSSNPKSAKFAPLTTVVGYWGNNFDDYSWDNDFGGPDYSYMRASGNTPLNDPAVTMYMYANGSLRVFHNGWVFYKKSQFNLDTLGRAKAILHYFGSDHETDQSRIIYLRGYIDDVNRIPQFKIHNYRLHDFFQNSTPYLTLGPMTGAHVVYKRGDCHESFGTAYPAGCSFYGGEQWIDLINDTDKAKDFTDFWFPSGYGNYPPLGLAIVVSSIDLWDLSQDEANNMKYVTVRASTNHCQSCNFANEDLSAFDLSGIDFSHADFEGATLFKTGSTLSKWTNCNFTEANLKDVKASGGNFSNSIFTGASISGADFSKANLFKADFTNAVDKIGEETDPPDFSSADLTCASFGGVDLKDFNFTDSIFTKPVTNHTDCRTDFSSSKNFPLSHFSTSKSDLAGLKLNNTKFAGFTGNYFKNVNMDYAEMEGDVLVSYGTDAVNDIKGSSWKNSRLGSSTLTGVDMENVEFSNSDLRGTVFNASNLAGANFTSAFLGASSGSDVKFGASMYEATLTGANFKDTSLAKVNFSEAYMSGTIFTGATVDLADFSGAWLVGVDFTSALSLKGVTLTGAFLMGADLSGRDLGPQAGEAGRSSLRGANLSGANITNAILNAADLSDLKISTEAGSSRYPYKKWSDTQKMVVSITNDTIHYLETNPLLVDAEATARITTDSLTICPDKIHTGPCIDPLWWIYQETPPDDGGLDPDQ